MKIDKRIEELLKENGWSQNILAQKLKCRQSTVSMWITGKQEPSSSLRRKLCEIFNISESELFATAPVTEKRAEYLTIRTIPLIGWSELSTNPTANQTSQFLHVVRRERNLFAVTIDDDSMVPEFYPGDILITQALATPPVDSYVLVLERKTGTALLRQYKKYGVKAVLHPLNPRYSDTPFSPSLHTVIGKVIEKRKIY